MSAPAPGEPRAGIREWSGLAVLALPTMVLALDMTVLHLAVPHLAADLAPDGTQLLWIVDIYGFMIAGWLIAMGSLGDRFGRRRLLMIGSACFAVATTLAAHAPSAEVLIGARAFMGMAGATLMPATLSLISTMFRVPVQRRLAIGAWAAAFSGGLAMGPVLGGVLLEHFRWGSVFLLGSPVMVLVLVSAPVLLPESRDTRSGRVDPLSIGLSLAAVLPIVHGAKQLADGSAPMVPGVLIAAGIAAGILFARRQRWLSDPLVDLLSLPRRGRGILLVLLLSSGTSGGISLLVAQYLQLVAGMPPLMAGLSLVPAAGAMLTTSMVAPLIARRVRPVHVVATALIVSATGFLLLTLVESRSDAALVVLGFTLVYAGGSPVTSLGTDLVVGAAPSSKAGAASAVSETGTELGVALGVAVLGLVSTAIYRREIDAAGGDTLAEAVATAQRMPPGSAARLLASARDAFTTGLNLAALGCALLLTALATATLMPRPSPRSTNATTPSTPDHP